MKLEALCFVQQVESKDAHAFQPIRSIREKQTHLPHKAAAEGEPGPQTMPVRIRSTMSNPTLVRAATGVNSVKIPAMKTPPPKIHLAPNFSAKFPLKCWMSVEDCTIIEMITSYSKTKETDQHEDQCVSLLSYI